MKIGMAVAVAAVTVAGVVGAITAGSSDPAKVGTAAGQQAPGTRSLATANDVAAATILPVQGASPAPAAAGGSPGMAQPLQLPAHPTVQDVERILTGITAQILAPPSSTASTQPLTKEQVESQLREQLRRLGITF